MANAEQIITWAASQIGTKENPPDSNKVWYWDYYKQQCGVNYNGSPWCAAFVTAGMSLHGEWDFTKDEGRFRYCPSLVAWAKQNGQWLDRDEVCKTGDIILFANGGTACHVGFVEKRIDSSQVQTIEGNTSVSSNDNGGAVMRRIRKYGSVGSSWYILGFVRPKYSDSNSGTWEKDAHGWWYKRTDGSYPQNEWVKINNEWYYFNEKGYALTGWQKIDNVWYYLRTKNDKGLECSMVTGWAWIADAWYYFDNSGAMKIGWVSDKNKWYYLQSNGKMINSTCYEIDGEWFLFNSKGEMMTSVNFNSNGSVKF